jgi:hypothetical protein
MMKILHDSTVYGSEWPVMKTLGLAALNFGVVQVPEAGMILSMRRVKSGDS